MGLIEVSERTSPQRAAEIHARLMGMRRPVPNLSLVPASPPRGWWMPFDSHVQARTQFMIENLEARLKAIEALIRQSDTLERVQAIPLIKQMCQFYNVSYRDICSDRRTKAIVFPRQKMMWVIKQRTSQSYPEIGQRFGGRDHTTVLHSVRKIDALLASNDPSVADLKGWVSE